jgi:shikimate dehydrogenase
VKAIYTLADLKQWPKATRGVTPPIRLGVVGDPVEHSLSPQMHNAALRDCGIDAQYARFHVTADELKEFSELARQLDFIGLNVTVPHKTAAVRLISRTDELATKIGAVNTIKLSGGEMVGFNTDGDGFARAIREEFSVDLRDLRVLLLGAGGAARAIAFRCAAERCERLVIANRHQEKAQRLAAELREYFAEARVLGPVARLEAIALSENAIRNQIANTDLVVNATPLGLGPGDPSPLPARLLAPHLLVYDTVYRIGKTPLVRAAEEAAARSAEGRSMLLHQGARSFEIWFDHSAPIEVMRAALAAT